MDPGNLPTEFVARLTRRLGAEATSFFRAFGAPPDGLRVNTLRLAPREFEKISPFPLGPLSFPHDTYVLLGGDRPGRHPFHAAGLYYLQDPSAAVVGALVDARPGERVLDLAAAPGGKTTQLAAGMRNTGILIANDVSRARASELAGNLERCGVHNAMVTSDSPDRLARQFSGFFDRVLVDAPCSGESMFPKSAAALADWSPSAVLGCARRQIELLHEAASLVRSGGVLVYSTCTFAEEENEETVVAFLDAHPDFEPLSLREVDGAEQVEVRSRASATPGMDAAVAGVGQAPLPEGANDEAGGERQDVLDANVSKVVGAPHSDITAQEETHLGRREVRDTASGVGETRNRPAGAAGYRLWPHRLPGAGHFVFAFRRLGARVPDPDRAARRQRDSRSAIRSEARSLLGAFLSDVYPGTFLDEAALFEAGEALFALPEEAPEPRGLRFVSPGLRLGTVRRGRFDPAHALVMALPPALARNRLDLSVNDARVGLYLSGHPLDAPGEPGWIPVAVAGFALGWGKRVGGTVKNHYPKGLRWR